MRCTTLRPLFVATMALASMAGVGRAQEAEAAAAPPTVRVAEVAALTQTEPRTFIGTVAARHTVQVVARVSGALLEDAFKEGGLVRKGDLLFSIEDTTCRANLAIAKAVLMQARAEHAIVPVPVEPAFRLNPGGVPGTRTPAGLLPGDTGLHEAVVPFHSVAAAPIISALCDVQPV